MPDGLEMIEIQLLVPLPVFISTILDGMFLSSSDLLLIIIIDLLPLNQKLGFLFLWKEEMKMLAFTNAKDITNIHVFKNVAFSDDEEEE